MEGLLKNIALIVISCAISAGSAITAEHRIATHRTPLLFDASFSGYDRSRIRYTCRDAIDRSETGRDGADTMIPRCARYSKHRT